MLAVHHRIDHRERRATFFAYPNVASAAFVDCLCLFVCSASLFTSFLFWNQLAYYITKRPSHRNQLEMILQYLSGACNITKNLHIYIYIDICAHCAEPYVVEAQSIVKSLSADSDNDTSFALLALNIITDHCPELTK